MSRFNFQTTLLCGTIIFVLLFMDTKVAGDTCTSATLNGAPRACDVTTDTDCPLCRPSHPQMPNISDSWGADYNAYPEVKEYLNSLDQDIDNDSILGSGDNWLELINLGQSTALNIALDDITTDYIPGESGDIIVARVTMNADSSFINKPAVLFNCGIHPQEWIAPETCLGLVDWLVKSANAFDNYNDDALLVQYILGSRELWFVVMANTAGRIWDQKKDDATYNDGIPPSERNWRKNRQWDTSFNCMNDWDVPLGSGSGSCSWSETISTFEDTYWHMGDVIGGTWVRSNLPGINVGNNFSYGWGAREWLSFQRDMITDNFDVDTDIPEHYNCYGFPMPVAGNENCEAKFQNHPFCLLYDENGDMVAGGERYGCFAAPVQVEEGYCNSFKGYADGVNHNVCKQGWVYEWNPPWPEPSDWTPGWNYHWILLECGQGKTNLSDIASSSPFRDVSSEHDKLLQVCDGGARISCIEDEDCRPGGPIDLEHDDFTVDSMNSIDGEDRRVPHHVYSDEQMQNLFCYEGYCAIDQHRTCCDRQYAGRRPFETVEARILRDLINNMSFSFVIDMHSAEGTIIYRCTNFGGGCEAGNYYDNGILIRDIMRNVYNQDAEDHWADSHGNDYPITHPDHNLHLWPSFLNMVDDDEDEPGGGFGYLSTWASSKIVSDNDFGFTESNFDLNTFRAIPSYTWELGTADTYETNEGMMFRLIRTCDPYDTGLQGGQMSARLGVENQLEGAKAAIEYIAEQALAPGVARDHTGGIIVPGRSDLGLAGLRIHDGHGRGVQQTERRWDKVADDKEAVIKIPAGLWAITTELIADGDWPSGHVMDAQLEFWVVKYDIEEEEEEYEVLVKNLDISTEVGNRREVTWPYRFDETDVIYEIHAKVTTSVGIDDDYGVNNEVISRVMAINCDETDEIPNWASGNQFCEAGVPFKDENFKCNSDLSRCRECWYDEWPPQDCESGLFCNEGFCDRRYTVDNKGYWRDCWTGRLEDKYEGVFGELGPLLGMGSYYWQGTMHKIGNESCEIEMDIDAVRIKDVSASEVLDNSYYDLKVAVENKCYTGYIDESLMDEVEIRIEQKINSDTDEELLGWTHPSRLNGVIVGLTAEQVVGLRQDKPIKIEMRNPNLDSFVYSAMATVEYTGKLAVNPDIATPHQIHGHMTVEINLEEGQLGSFGTMPDSITQDSILFLNMAESDPGANVNTNIVVQNARGEKVGRQYLEEDSLAVDLLGLMPEDGPYRITIQNSKNKVRGSLYLCPRDFADCLIYEPRNDLCGVDCRGESDLCCFDEVTGALSCVDIAEDDYNCGGCGVTCEWDETCLHGICARGEGISCWETECPEGTWCGSDVWLFRTDPHCVSLLVDNENCGWYGHECAENKTCAQGLCVLKRKTECSAECDIGESCCWVLGQEWCFDLQNDWSHCGSCDNTCDVGDVCVNGICLPWFMAYDPCPFGSTNCGQCEGIECVNLESDNQNCGACRNVCPDNSECQNGICTDIQNAEGYDVENPQSP